MENGARLTTLPNYGNVNRLDKIFVCMCSRTWRRLATK